MGGERGSDNAGGAGRAPQGDGWPDGQSVPVPRPGTSSVPLQDSVGLYDEVGHALIMLNPSAAAIWSLCDGVATLDQIVDELAAAHGTGPGDIADDVRQTLRELANLGLVSGLTRGPPGR